MSEQVSLFVGDPPVQFQPVSTDQQESQPSPLSVLPSSHTSSPTLRPSPQTGDQVDGGVFKTLEIQLYPTSGFQVLLQPSLLFVLPSSHVSFAIISMLSPHIVDQVSDVVGLPPVQVQPVST